MFNEEKELEFQSYLQRSDISIFRRNEVPVTMQALRLAFEAGWIPRKRKQRSCAACMLPTSTEILTLL